MNLTLSIVTVLSRFRMMLRRSRMLRRLWFICRALVVRPLVCRLTILLSRLTRLIRWNIFTWRRARSLVSSTRSLCRSFVRCVVRSLPIIFTSLMLTVRLSNRSILIIRRISTMTRVRLTGLRTCLVTKLLWRVARVLVVKYRRIRS